MEEECTEEEVRGILLFPSAGAQAFPTADADEVHPGLWVGGEGAAVDLASLRGRRVGAVLNAAWGRDAGLNMVEGLAEEEYRAAGIRFLGVPAVDLSSYPLHEHFAAATAFVGAALAEGRGALLHCRLGVSRSAALALAYLVQGLGMTLQEAARQVRARREVLPNDGFLRQLCRLNQQVHAPARRPTAPSRPAPASEPNQNVTDDASDAVKYTDL